jgi:hypothetical protein
VFLNMTLPFYMSRTVSREILLYTICNFFTEH